MANVKIHDNGTNFNLYTEKNLLDVFKEWGRKDRVSASSLITDAMVIYAKMRTKKESEERQGV